MRDTNEHNAFRAFSAKLGSDPLRVQGPGGNTSIKNGDVMWIKASGTELADAVTRNIFMAVDHAAAMTEAQGLAGDGSCMTSIVDPNIGLRPSIETTFHAALHWSVVAHTHSIATLAHCTSAKGLEIALQKLDGLSVIVVPYVKPGLPLTTAIMARLSHQTQIIILENHGLICAGPDVATAEALMEKVETRLALPRRKDDTKAPGLPPPQGFDWADASWIATDPRATRLATSGSYYPDHVVFLGAALPGADHAGNVPAVLIDGVGIAIRKGATPSQRALLRCLSDFLAHLPDDWAPRPIGPDAEAELLNWDAEKYRQALASRS